MMHTQTIVYVAGKSGGHILPALTLAQHHKNFHPSDKIVLYTTNTELDKKIISDATMLHEIKSIPLENFPYKRFTHYPRFIKNLCTVFFSCFTHLRMLRPQKIVSMGGYISVPVCLAAWLLKIPIDMYELNVIPGKANRLIAPLARTIFICFGASATHFKRGCSLIDYPVRFSYEQRIYPQAQALIAQRLSPEKKTLLIMGGSQGSLFINKLIREFIEKNPQIHASLQIIHQTGSQDSIDWQLFYSKQKIPALAFDYCNAMEKYYAAADIIICRAGAGTLFEVQFFNKRCITIPLETSITDHQKENAQAAACQFPQLFTVLDQKSLEQDSKKLHTTLLQLLAEIKFPERATFKQTIFTKS